MIYRLMPILFGIALALFVLSPALLFIILPR